MPRLRSLLAGVMMVALVTGGCSGEAPNATSTSSSSTGTTSSSSTVTTEPGDGPTLVLDLLEVPVCGPSDPPPAGCEPRPLVGVEVVVRAAGGETVASLRSDRAGRVVLTLPEGTYTVEPGEAPPPSITPAPFTVEVSGPARVERTVRYESNMQ